MKSITLSADEHLVEKARKKARSEKRSLNALFRDWLQRYVARDGSGEKYDQLMQRLEDVRAGGRFSRDEMNER